MKKKVKKKETPIAVCKIMILRLLDLVDYPLTNSRLIEFFVGHGHMDYFLFSQAIGELIDSNHLEASTLHHMTCYQSTESGRETLSLFKDNLSDELIEDMHKWLKEEGYELRRDIDITAVYYPVKRGRREEYLVEAQINEKGELMMKLTLNVVSRDQAEAICNGWSKKSDRVYSTLIDMLLLEED